MKQWATRGIARNRCEGAIKWGNSACAPRMPRTTRFFLNWDVEHKPTMRAALAMPVRSPSHLKAINSSEFRRLHVAVFIPGGHMAFATRAARVDIYLLAQNEPLALGYPVLAIGLSMRGFFVRAV